MKPILWTKDFLLLLIANAFSVCSFQMLFPTLPVFLAANGNSSQEIGTVMGVFTFSALAIRLLHGVGFGICSTLLASILGDLVPASRRGEGIGLLDFGVAVTSSSAPFIGLWIYNRWHPIELFLASGFALLLSLLSSALISRSKLMETYSTALPEKRWSNLFIEKAGAFPAFLTFLLGICFGSTMSFMALFGKEHQISNIGWFFFASTCGSFAARMISGRVFDRRGHAFVVIPGALLGTAGLVMLSQSYSVVLLVVSALLYGLGSGTLLPPLQAWILNQVHPERRTEGSAMFYNAFDIGIGGGSMVLGFIASVSSYSFVYLCSAFIMSALLAIYLVSRRRSAVRMNEPAASSLFHS